MCTTWEYKVLRMKAKRVVESISDNKKLLYRKGDIIKFQNGQRGWENKTFLEWFLTEKDYVKFLKKLPKNQRETRIPIYAVNQYGIITERYRISKVKYRKTFRDYGSMIMMLTGTSIGYIRKYYIFNPWIKTYSFPHTSVDPKLKNYKKVLQTFTEDSEQCRNELISTLYNLLN